MLLVNLTDKPELCHDKGVQSLVKVAESGAGHAAMGVGRGAFEHEMVAVKKVGAVLGVQRVWHKSCVAAVD